MIGKSIKPISQYIENHLLPIFFPTLLKVEILNKCWLLEISFPTETYRGYHRKAKLQNGTKIDLLLRKKSHRPTYFEFKSYLNCLQFWFKK